MPPVDSCSVEQELNNKVANLEEQLAGSKRKTVEQSNACQKLKLDLKLAQKVYITVVR